MKSNIQNYLKLQTALINEKAKLEARLNAINKVLGGEVSVAATSSTPASPAPATTTTKGKRTFSAATRAKMKASQQARWAKKKGNVAVKAAVDASPAPKKAKRTMSAATKAKMSAAHQARWAKKKGKDGSVAAPAAKKTKRKYSAEAKAKMAAGAKKHWAKVNAAKKPA